MKLSTTQRSTKDPRPDGVLGVGLGSMRTLIALASSAAILAACGPFFRTETAPAPTAKACARVAELAEQREALIAEMDLTPAERQALDRKRVLAISQSSPAGARVAQSLGDAQGIKAGGGTASDQGWLASAGGQLSAAGTPRNALVPLVARIDRELRSLPTSEACGNADRPHEPSTGAD